MTLIQFRQAERLPYKPKRPTNHEHSNQPPGLPHLRLRGNSRGAGRRLSLRLRRGDYTKKDLEHWAKAVGGQDWEDAFVFFKHEDAGAGPRLAAEFMAIAGAG